LSPQDILIEPNLGSAACDRFCLPERRHRPRRGGGAAASPRLSAYASATNAYRDYLARRAAREPGLPPIKFVRVDEQSKRYEKTIMAEMQPLVGKPLDLDQVGKRITDLYGLGKFRDFGLPPCRASRCDRASIEVRGARKFLGAQLSAVRPESGGRFPGQ